MQIAMVGCAHEDFSSLENLTKIFHKRFDVDQGYYSYVLVCTCNRAELYMSGPNLIERINQLAVEIPEEVKKNMFYYTGENCFLHLALVTSGLESLIISETEIQGQVKKAYEAACKERKLEKELHFLFQKALTIGKTIRSQFQLGKGLPNVEHIVLQLGSQKFENYKDVKILFIGASEINCRVAKFLKYRGIKNIFICNRTLAKANEVTQEHGWEVYPWEKRYDWTPFNWVVSGIKTDDDDKFYFEKNMFPTAWEDAKVIFDLGIPHNIDPSLEKTHNLKIYDIKGIGDVVQRERFISIDSLEEVENAVRKKVEYFSSKHSLAGSN